MEETFDSRVLALVVPTLPDPVAVIEATVSGGSSRNLIRWHNSALAAFVGQAGADLSGSHAAALGSGLGGEEIDHLLSAGVTATVETAIARADGAPLAARLTVTPIAEGTGRRLFSVTIRERASEARAREHLEASEERFRALAEQAPIGIFRSDVGLRLGYANARCAEILGRDLDLVVGNGWLDALLPDDRERVCRALEQVLDGSEIELDLIRAARPDGNLRWLSIRVAPVRTSGRAAGFVGSLEDVTDRKELEEVLAHDATHDRLTGLPNRTLLWSRLEGTLAGPTPELAVLFLDLDDFKLVNDSLGHEAGDQLLLAVAERLALAVRPDDLVTRFGGDEFVVVCSDVKNREQAELIAERLAVALGAPFVVAGREVGVTASIGIVLGEPDLHDPESLLRDADVALYQAKAGGKARVAFFDERARQGASERLSMATELRRAIDEDRISAHFQPVVDLSTGRVVAVEALARWEGSSFGPVPPTQFIALAEDTGMIGRLGTWILRASCMQLSSWRTRLHGAAPAFVSVNLSVRQLADPFLVDTVLTALRDARLQGHHLCLEITESVFMDDIDRAVSLLTELKSFGVRLAMDDFGTGYSSLASLRRFPGHVLKIDRSFVVDLQHEGSGAAIISAVVDMAGAFGLDVVAEGIESQEDAEQLNRLGCRLGQGYHLARPMPADALADWLSNRSRPVEVVGR